MKHSITWGGILGLVLIAFSLGLYLFEMTESKPAQWLSYLLIGGVLFFAIKAKRDAAGGFISFGGGLGTGVSVAFVGGILAAIYTYVLFVYIDPGMLEEMLLRAEDQMYEQNMPDDQIDMAMEWTAKFMQPGVLSFFVIIIYTVVGFIASLISSAILKKEDTSFEANFK